MGPNFGGPLKENTPPSVEKGIGAQGASEGHVSQRVPEVTNRMQTSETVLLVSSNRVRLRLALFFRGLCRSPFQPESLATRERRVAKR